MLLAGTAGGMALSYTSVWASDSFGIGPQRVAFLFVVAGIAGAIGNPLLGLLSDRFGARRPFVVGQLVVCAIAFATYSRIESYDLAMIAVAFSGFGVMGLTLAIVADLVRARPNLPSGSVARILAAERTAWSIGIILGPAAAALIVGLLGDVRPVFIAAAIVQLAAAAWAWSVAEPTRQTSRLRAAGAAPIWPMGRRIALVALVIGLILLTLPAQTRTMYLPLFITDVLGEPRSTVGPAFALNAMTAVLAMPYMGALSDRIGAQRVMYVGALVGFVYCVLLTLVSDYTTTLIVQVLIGLSISLWSTGSLIYVQQLLPDRAGAAGGLYLTVQQLTPVVSGLALGPIAEQFGIPAAFGATAALLIVASAIIVAAHRILSRGDDVSASAV